MLFHFGPQWHKSNTFLISMPIKYKILKLHDDLSFSEDLSENS